MGLYIGAELVNGKFIVMFESDEFIHFMLFSKLILKNKKGQESNLLNKSANIEPLTETCLKMYEFHRMLVLESNSQFLCQMSDNNVS